MFIIQDKQGGLMNLQQQKPKKNKRRISLKLLTIGGVITLLLGLGIAYLIIDDRAVAHYNLGVNLLKEGSYQTAIIEFRKAIRLKPGFAEAHYNLGFALWEQSEKQGLWNATLNKFEAENEFRKTVKLKPNLAEAHYMLGAALGDKKDFEGADAELFKAIQLRPNYTGAFRLLALSLDLQHRDQEARQYWIKVLESGENLDPEEINKIKARLKEKNKSWN